MYKNYLLLHNKSHFYVRFLVGYSFNKQRVSDLSEAWYLNETNSITHLVSEKKKKKLRNEFWTRNHIVCKKILNHWAKLEEFSQYTAVWDMTNSNSQNVNFKTTSQNVNFRDWGDCKKFIQ